MGIFDKFKIGFKKSSSAFANGLKEIIVKKELDDKSLDDIENFLIQSDVGVAASAEIKSIISEKKIDPNKDLNSEIKNYAHVLISLKNNLNLEDLILKIKNKLKNKFITSEDILITRERHRQNLEQSLNYLKNFEEKNEAEDFDKAAEDLRLATRHLGMIVGKVDVEEILGSIFKDFCIGK